ncbi:hypothetical protein BDY19DRAFT_912732 [Irpex rosettiformis]|uniref:Uncharacterized protein n=1 Tax=Irpex rosettiformis TaxID=378272 RepID=A0ACB8UJF0_9APHY|nr:hypothetical protein BDY19DRAFT_912732 [Irpex rosettiformis]
MNGTQTQSHPANPNVPAPQAPAQTGRHATNVKPPPTGPTPPAPSAAPPAPPNNNANASAPTRQPNGTVVNGKGKKKPDPPVDPSQLYESLKNRIATLEEDMIHNEEEGKRILEEAQNSVAGLEDSAVHAKYIELFSELKKQEREHAKEKQKLVKDKDAAKSQLTKANQTKAKMENLARELQKDNKRLREDSKRLAQCVEEAQDEIMQMKNDMAKRAERAKIQDTKYREMPDIVVKVVCKYRAELFFKISRKTKLSRLFNAWTDRMESTANAKKGVGASAYLSGGGAGNEPKQTPSQSQQGQGGQQQPVGASGTASSQVNGSAPAVSTSSMQFIFSHGGRTLEADQTPEEVGMEEGDEILAVEIMDLTEGPGTEEIDESANESRRQKLQKNWQTDPQEARRTMEEIFDGVVRERLKEVLRQYELRERHFECVIRSKELEVLLSRARAAEQKQLAESEKVRAEKAEDEAQTSRKQLEAAQNGQTMLIDKLIACCKEPNAERTQRIFASLREELEKKGTIPVDGNVGG